MPKRLKSASILTIGQLGTYGCSFLRNMILARELSKADFGLAAAFSMTIALLELTGKMYFGAQIIQSPFGGRKSFQSTFHIFLFIIGLCSGLLMLACSPLISGMLNAPQALWAFGILGLIPLFKGLEHLDNFRYRRHHIFTPGVLSELVPQLVVTAATWPIARMIGDFSAVIWILLAKAAMTMAMTHLFAKRKYYWSLNKDFAKDLFHFSWPLLINGFLIFASQQADQFIVGTLLNLELLAQFSASYSLAAIPCLVIAPVISSLYLTTLSQEQKNEAKFRASYKECSYITVSAASVFLIPIMGLGELLVTLLYGEKYQGAGPLIALLCVAGLFRCQRIAPALAALSKADTKNQLYSNIARCVSLPLVFVFLSLEFGLLWVGYIAILAEVLSATVSTFRLNKLYKVPVSISLPPIFLIVSYSLLITVPILVSPGQAYLHLSTTAISLISAIALTYRFLNIRKLRPAS